MSIIPDNWFSWDVFNNVLLHHSLIFSVSRHLWWISSVRMQSHGSNNYSNRSLSSRCNGCDGEVWLTLIFLIFWHNINLKTVLEYFWMLLENPQYWCTNVIMVSQLSNCEIFSYLSLLNHWSIFNRLSPRVPQVSIRSLGIRFPNIL